MVIWAVLAVQGLEHVHLGWGKLPRKLPEPRTKVRECKTACLDSGSGLIMDESAGSGLVMGEPKFSGFSTKAGRHDVAGVYLGHRIVSARAGASVLWGPAVGCCGLWAGSWTVG